MEAKGGKTWREFFLEKLGFKVETRKIGRPKKK